MLLSKLDKPIVKFIYLFIQTYLYGLNTFKYRKYELQHRYDNLCTSMAFNIDFFYI